MNSRRAQMVCRTCLKVINENELYINADCETKFGNIIDILETCVSELNTDLSDGVVMCYNCTKMLRISYEFKLKCLTTEEKIFGYLKRHDLPISTKINLVDIITNSNRLENSIDLNSEKYTQNENVATCCKQIGETSNHYSLDIADMNFFRKDNSCQENDNDIIGSELYKSSELNKSVNLNKNNYNDDILMFDGLTHTDVDNLLRNNYNINPVQENNDYRNVNNNIGTVPYNHSNSMDWDMDFSRCRLNSSREEYCESLFEIPPCTTTEINVEANSIEQFVFKSPLRPNLKRKPYYLNSF